MLMYTFKQFKIQTFLNSLCQLRLQHGEVDVSHIIVLGFIIPQARLAPATINSTTVPLELQVTVATVTVVRQIDIISHTVICHDSYR